MQKIPAMGLLQGSASPTAVIGGEANITAKP